MMYGKPTKLVRHVDDTTFTIEPQRFHVHTFWKYDSGAAARSDGDDLQGVKTYPEGSRIKKHKVEILITPETIEPQQLYIGRLKLSFNDIYSEPLVGGIFTQASFQDTATENFVATSTPVGPQLYANQSGLGRIKINGHDTANREIGGSGSGDGIAELKLNDTMKHWLSLKKVTVFDQRPLLGSRWQRIPSKVKRINSGTYYGLYIFNDSTRGGTPANTQVTVNIKEYIEEMAI